MYIFVRLNAIFAMVIGLLLIGLGIGFVVSGFAYHQQLLDITNAYIMPGTGYILTDTRLYSSGIGFLFFLVGLSAAAQGQLAMTAADTAYNSGKLVKLLTKMVTDQKPTLINHVNVNTESTKTQTEPVVITAELKEE